MIHTNQRLPDFTLDDLAGAPHRLIELHGKLGLINFWSAECPWSEDADHEIMAYMPGWQGQVVWWSIAANAHEPIETLRQAAVERGLPLILVDRLGQAARLFEAKTTPHCFLVDRQGILRYQGALNDRTFRKRIPERFYLRDAVYALLGGRLPDPAETPAYGCTISSY